MTAGGRRGRHARRCSGAAAGSEARRPQVPAPPRHHAAGPRWPPSRPPASPASSPGRTARPSATPGRSATSGGRRGWRSRSPASRTRRPRRSSRRRARRSPATGGAWRGSTPRAARRRTGRSSRRRRARRSGLSACCSPNHTEAKASASQVPSRSSLTRWMMPRKSSSSRNATAAAGADHCTTAHSSRPTHVVGAGQREDADDDGEQPGAEPEAGEPLERAPPPAAQLAAPGGAR